MRFELKKQGLLPQNTPQIETKCLTVGVAAVEASRRHTVGAAPSCVPVSAALPPLAIARRLAVVMFAIM